ncbi:hypothetical protein FGG08_001951 [Glutinoglossum americanum]|uniref:Uncharacterized protein n=1 Tax=Glutinoglossum americanum TaxID=1670608 RepID=A0A9P8L4W7_9PEZI|nr:hypothetical protein FGG08_001951 [Glutinoglossum americanum]
MSSPSTARTGPKKRKHDTELEAREKVVEQKRTKKTSSFNDELISNGLNHAFAKMDSRLLSDYVAQRTRRFGGDLSSVEIEDKYIPAKSLRTHAAFAHGILLQQCSTPGTLVSH